MTSDAYDLLQATVKKKMPGADKESVAIVAAVTGLLAAVAYADRTITDEESAHLKAALGRIHGLPQSGVEAVAEVLHEHALRLSASFVPRFTRVLREELGEEHRAEVLSALLEMAAADGVISLEETTSLRNIAGSLGLTQAHYNGLQEKYRALLSFS